MSKNEVRALNGFRKEVKGIIEEKIRLNKELMLCLVSSMASSAHEKSVLDDELWILKESLKEL